MSAEFSAEALLVHAGGAREPGTPVTPPLVPASIFVSEGDPVPGRGYGRESNPGWEALEDALGALEQATAVLFASGQAASAALMLTLAGLLRPFGVSPVLADQCDLVATARALAGGPAVLWAETPANPLLRVADLARLGEIAAAAGAPMIVDNTVATGLLQRPLDRGAAASLYSLTKTISGHSDLLLGAVVTRDEELAAGLRAWRIAAGGIPGPFEAWLALRGMKTLRLARQAGSAQAIAEHLAAHPRVRAVHYPGLLTGPELAVAAGQMPSGFGPLLSFEVASARAADAVVAASALIVPATSFGGVESTWERRGRWPAETAPEGLIRLSVGVEPVGDLMTDIDQALEVL